jgi:hypothetical protein
MNAPFADPCPIEIDPRPCERCGLTIDHHRMVDDGEGPEFFCLSPDELTTPELERRAELIREIEIAAMVREMELADPRDRWKHTGEAPRRPTNGFSENPIAYRTAQSTIDAFFFVVRTKSTEDIAEWLARHPRDEQHLYKLWKQKCSTK